MNERVDGVFAVFVDQDRASIRVWLPCAVDTHGTRISHHVDLQVVQVPGNPMRTTNGPQRLRNALVCLGREQQAIAYGKPVRRLYRGIGGHMRRLVLDPIGTAHNARAGVCGENASMKPGKVFHAEGAPRKRTEGVFCP